MSIIGVRGKSFRGDLAIDDIEIEEGPCRKYRFYHFEYIEITCRLQFRLTKLPILVIVILIYHFYFQQLAKSVCSDQPCVHGFCIGTPGKISCICDSDYTGKYCDQQLVGQLQEQPLIISTNKCTNNPCKNGFCIQTPERSTCVCSPGFRGDRCDIADPSSN